MKKMMKVLWKKGFLSFVLTVSFLAGAIAPGGYVRAAAPAAIPATLLKSVYLIATRDLRISGCNFFYLKIKGLCDFLRKRF